MPTGKTKQNIINKKSNSYDIPDVSKLDKKVKNISIKELNAILKGEYMAIDSYEKYIKNITDADTKAEFQKIQKEHKRHAIKLAERIQILGGIPVSSVGVKGKVVETMSNIKDMGRKSTADYIRKAQHGEDTGIKMTSKIIKGDLDKDSLSLINSMLKEDENHVNILSEMMSPATNNIK
ncbi:hypothetical protein CPAST_c15640 [Clostridium pasteurianum DSM 525 = ATCC 6013]|uniref:DUF2383 domain-containing protein n=1 Tax=Clostridium pasteurianum DSM 525 = ATCC 6013 TaxID=1262449 RepID=A0A0H3J2I0_CLOPA|nr:DUF2383 domain-containing protein [Clostridium pasteurianum]AJA47639.1 hypothetical protein CPAST_c15640 [Clostridium pasteurianum DSM 525 = ATCC 6013]AJA51627.1 hypothetical protein CLPA_c15640 [Clostridium pasteurianum DSM 525 = ATCC 6013]AOZ74948.1 hypothetical protein AQ983_07560 [Clostridium pasteurianum DSM 525 = ATCC 6013]AOZ78743.1 hypothetical protein AQ984_07550 [Clostridium pasteurianum]ELP58021.1 hypothetical protein F502_16280 [Clostridium pasteurianum DSM 525 = ATCC 6013]